MQVYSWSDNTFVFVPWQTVTPGESSRDVNLQGTTMPTLVFCPNLAMVQHPNVEDSDGDTRPGPWAFATVEAAGILEGPVVPVEWDSSSTPLQVRAGIAVGTTDDDEALIGVDNAGNVIWRIDPEVVRSYQVFYGWVAVINTAGEEVWVDPTTGTEVTDSALVREIILQAEGPGANSWEAAPSIEGHTVSFVFRISNRIDCRQVYLAEGAFTVDSLEGRMSDGYGSIIGVAQPRWTGGHGTPAPGDHSFRLAVRRCRG